MKLNLEIYMTIIRRKIETQLKNLGETLIKGLHMDGLVENQGGKRLLHQMIK
jgi:hypothetical protein